MNMPSRPVKTISLDDAAQKILELVLLPRPLLSAGDAGSAYEIVRAELMLRPPDTAEERAHRKAMWFRDWDDHGKKGTTQHFVNSASDSFLNYISSGVWALCVFVLGVVGFFVVLCLFCIFAFGGGDEYEKAQNGKRRSSGRGSGSWGGNDVEKARRFRSAEELGIRSGGKVVGVGKSD